MPMSDDEARGCRRQIASHGAAWLSHPRAERGSRIARSPKITATIRGAVGGTRLAARPIMATLSYEFLTSGGVETSQDAREVDAVRRDLEVFEGREGPADGWGWRRTDRRLPVTNHLAASLHQTGFAVTRYPLEDRPSLENLDVELRGDSLPEESILVTACLPSMRDGDSTGLAALSALGRVLAGRHFARSVRLVALAEDVNDEGVANDTGPSAGSLQYASRLREQKHQIAAALCLGSLRFGEPGSVEVQGESWLSRLRDNVLFVGGFNSRTERRVALRAFEESGSATGRSLTWPVAATPSSVAHHRAFHDLGAPAFTITTPPRPLHGACDPEKLVAVVKGIASMIGALSEAALDQYIPSAPSSIPPPMSADWGPFATR